MWIRSAFGTRCERLLHEEIPQVLSSMVSHCRGRYVIMLIPVVTCLHLAHSRKLTKVTSNGSNCSAPALRTEKTYQENCKRPTTDVSPSPSNDLQHTSTSKQRLISISARGQACIPAIELSGCAYTRSLLVGAVLWFVLIEIDGVFLTCSPLASTASRLKTLYRTPCSETTRRNKKGRFCCFFSIRSLQCSRMHWK